MFNAQEQGDVVGAGDRGVTSMNQRPGTGVERNDKGYFSRKPGKKGIYLLFLIL